MTNARTWFAADDWTTKARNRVAVLVRRAKVIGKPDAFNMPTEMERRYSPTQRPFSPRSRRFKRVRRCFFAIAVACVSRSLLVIAEHQGCIMVMGVGERKC